jgi:hypothetical protein
LACASGRDGLAREIGCESVSRGSRMEVSLYGYAASVVVVRLRGLAERLAAQEGAFPIGRASARRARGDVGGLDPGERIAFFVIGAVEEDAVGVRIEPHVARRSLHGDDGTLR